MARKLRIAVSVFFGLLTVALCVLWVRSYWRADYAASHRNQIIITSNNGYVTMHSSYFSITDNGTRWTVNSTAASGSVPKVYYHSTRSLAVAAIPYSFAVAVGSVAVVAPWFPYRFSLRTMLIATTLVAVGLGAIVWLR